MGGPEVLRLRVFVFVLIGSREGVIPINGSCFEFPNQRFLFLGHGFGFGGRAKVASTNLGKSKLTAIVICIL